MSFLRVLILPLLFACGSSEMTDEPAPITTSNEIQARDDFTFEPSHLTVPAGTTVRWTNVGVHGHTVTSGESGSASAGGDFDGSLNAGVTFEHTFDAVGDHPYFCRPHAGLGMKGVVTVTAK